MNLVWLLLIITVLLIVVAVICFIKDEGMYEWTMILGALLILCALVFGIWVVAEYSSTFYREAYYEENVEYRDTLIDEVNACIIIQEDSDLKTSCVDSLHRVTRFNADLAGVKIKLNMFVFKHRYDKRFEDMELIEILINNDTNEINIE